MNGSNSINFGKEITTNAKVRFTNSSVEDEGTLMVVIGFELPGGGLACTKKIPLSAERMKGILNALEVRSWEELPKKYARIVVVGDVVTKIGNILNEKWVEAN